MLMLSADQVRYCQVVRLQAGQEETLQGLSYQNKLFLRDRSYPTQQRQEAIKYARQAFLEHKAQVLYLVVEDQQRFIVWQQDEQLRLADQLALIDLKQLVAEMRNVGGVKIQDRLYRLVNYSRCFVGSEAVDWLSRRFGIDRSQAVRLGQRLVNEKWIHHVVDQHPFEDGYFFYRFYWDE